MDYQSILAIVFVILLSLFLYLKRKEIVFQRILYPVFYFAMYRTKLGINWMDFIAKKFGRALRIVSFIGVIVGFVGMAFISYELISNTVKLFVTPEMAPSIKPVMPFAAKGVFFVPFLYWILSIFVIAIIHEFSHGMVARAFNIPVKSSGFAFLGVLLPIIPAAFVEPDEKKMSKKGAREQLSVFAAGPFSNIVTSGILFLFVLFIMNPVAQAMLELNGAKVMGITKSSPAERAGLESGELIEQINGVQIKKVDDFTNFLSQQKPGSIISIKTNVSTRTMVLGSSPKNISKAFAGLSVSQNTKINEGFKRTYTETGTALIIWVIGLVYWILLLSLGIGLFNLLPIGPVDGGRMLLLVMQKWSPKHGASAWKIVSLFFMFIIFANLITGFIR